MGSVSGCRCSTTTEQGKSRIGSFLSCQQRCCSLKMGYCLLPPTAPLLHWIISSLPPQRQFANHNLVVIIPDDELWQLWLPRQKIPASPILPCHREGFFFFFPGIKEKKKPKHFKCSFLVFFKLSLSLSLCSVCYFTADGLALETNSIGCDTNNFHLPKEKRNLAEQVESWDVGLTAPVWTAALYLQPPHNLLITP